MKIYVFPITQLKILGIEGQIFFSFFFGGGEDKLHSIRCKIKC